MRTCRVFAQTVTYSSSQTWDKHLSTCAYKHFNVYFELFEVLSSICHLEASVPMFRYFMKVLVMVWQEKLCYFAVTVATTNI